MHAPDRGELPYQHVDQDGRDEAEAKQFRERVGAEEFEHTCLSASPDPSNHLAHGRLKMRRELT